MKHTKQMVFMAILTSLSVVLGVIDAQIAAFFAVIPGAKLGLANITIMLGILYFPFRDSLLMAILKSILVGLLLGAISTFIIGFAGTMLSFFGMYTLHKLFRKNISIVGISIVGGTLHSIGQIAAIIAFYTNIIAVVFIPQLILISVATGMLTGMLTVTVSKYIEKTRLFEML